MKEATKNTLRLPLIWGSCILLLLLLQLWGDFFIVNEIVEQPRYYCAVIFGAFAVLSGKFEAYYWFIRVQYKGVELHIKEHLLFTIIRSIVMVPVFILTDCKAVICYAAMFPFLHDGSYYAERNRIKPGTYSKGWLDQSKTSTAFSTKYFTPVVRSILFLTSIIVLILLRYKFL